MGPSVQTRNLGTTIRKLALKNRTTISFIPQQGGGHEVSAHTGNGAGVSASLNRLEATSSTEQEGQPFHTGVTVTSERKGARRETFKLPP